jgi:hypothetical protein
MSGTAGTVAQFRSYYVPPVVGLTIKVVGGDDGETFIFRVTGDGIDGTLTVAVPANEMVTIVDLATGKYTLTLVSSWDSLYDVSTAMPMTKSLTKGSSTIFEVTFTLSNRQWAYGHTYTN